MRHLLGAMLGLLAYVGAVAAMRGWSPRKETLAERFAAAGRPPQPKRGFRDQLLGAMSADVTSSGSSVNADLAVLDKTRDEYATERLVLVAGLTFMPVVFALFTAATSMLSWSPLSVVVIAVLGGVFGFLMARAVLSSQATERRRAFAVELSQFLDVVALQVAGSAGIDDALRRGAAGATSPGIVQIRRALDRARMRNESPWDSLGALAERIRVPELDELVSTVRLGDDRGARIKSSLMAKADSLRATQSADDLERAEKASERMGIPVTVMFFGFLMLLIAPLLSQLGNL
jgi:tight adherence protein C